MIKHCGNCNRFIKKVDVWNPQDQIICEIPQKRRSGIVDYESGKAYIRCEDWILSTKDKISEEEE